MIRILENKKYSYEYYMDEITHKVYVNNKRKEKLTEVKFKKGKYGDYAIIPTMNNINKTEHIYLRNLIATYIKKIKYEYVFLNNDYNTIHNLNEVRNIWNELYVDANFLISDNGDVYDKERKILIPYHLNNNRYKEVSIKSKRYFVHNLVFFSFNRNIQQKQNYHIDHIDNNSMNNNILNLQYIPHSINTSKDKKKKLPTGVYFKKNKYYASISYTISDITYNNIWLGDFDNVNEASMCYQRALKMMNNGINPLKSYTNKEIYYCFGNNKWFFLINNKKSLYYTSPIIAEKIKYNIENKIHNRIDNMNYYYNIFDKKYIFSIEYIDNHIYNIGSFYNKNVVDEINIIINEHKGDEGFLEWLMNFKNNELKFYQEEDKKNMPLFDNECYYDGKLWNIQKTYKNKNYFLCKTPDKQMALFINDSASVAIKFGVFKEWYEELNDFITKTSSLFKSHAITLKRYIVQYKDGLIINKFITFKDASKQFKNPNAYREISKCCRGIKKSYKGYTWQYEKE